MYSIPLSCILSVEEKSQQNDKTKDVVLIKCKDLQTMKIVVTNETKITLNHYVVHCEGSKSFEKEINVVKHIVNVVNQYLSNKEYEKLFAFKFRFEIEKIYRSNKPLMRNNTNIKESFYEFPVFGFKKSEIERGWNVYNIFAEIKRMNIKLHKYCTEKKVINGWRVFFNENFNYCSSYPEYFIIPSNITDEEIGKCMQFRSRKRLPVVTWKHPTNNCVIIRSSQPLVGLGRQTNSNDEKLLNSITQITNSKKLFIIDLRTKTNAWGNTIIGKGYEVTTNYENCELEFFGIDNIHVMLASYEYLEKAILQNNNDNWLSSLEKSGWLNHTSIILESAVKVVQKISNNNSLLIHCSDGWDRTSQVCSIAEILLDPYYRTIKGFIILIEKEWISFGHQFKTRSAILQNTDQYSPIFLQFLDVVWCVWSQFPEHFQFNEKFLLTIIHHVYSGLFGNFIFNNNRERKNLQMKNKTVSLWSFITKNLEHYHNFLYSPHNLQIKNSKNRSSVLIPRYDLKAISSSFWHNFYLRNSRDIKHTESSLMMGILKKHMELMKKMSRELKKEKRCRQEMEVEMRIMKKKLDDANLMIENQKKVIQSKEFVKILPAKRNMKIKDDHFTKNGET